jgi:hypothetical protein
LRAFFVDGVPSAQAAARFGYPPGSFRVPVPRSRDQPERDFFVPAARQGRPPAKRTRSREQVVTPRKQNLSARDISRALDREGEGEGAGEVLSPAAVALILKQDGFAKLPRRADDERPDRRRPVVADAADVRRLDPTPRGFRTKFGGLSLFLPWPVSADLDTALARAGLPGSEMVPAACALRSLLALKLLGNARHSHVMSPVLDEGPAPFAGLNVVPKRSFLTGYSSRVEPACYPKLMRDRFDTVGRLGLKWGTSSGLDSHTIPSHGDGAPVEKHHVSRRSRRQKGVSASGARDADARAFGCANGELREDQQEDEILRFVDFGEQRTGRPPEGRIFDSKLTTYANLDGLNRMGIRFVRLRRRSPKPLDAIARTATSAWRRVELESVSGAYKTPRALDRRVTLDDYDGPIRRLTVAERGHEEPTLLLTNQSGRPAAHLIGRHAQRMRIGNNIEDGVDFFHMDALSSAVAMEAGCGLQLTLMAGSLYRMSADRIGPGSESAKSRHPSRDFLDAAAGIAIDEAEVVVRFRRRGHDPLLRAAGFVQADIKVPCPGGKRLRLVFGGSAPGTEAEHGVNSRTNPH